MTNAEKIQQMTDEELAKMFYKLVQDCEYCIMYESCICNTDVPCKSMYMKWLQEEATDD